MHADGADGGGFFLGEGEADWWQRIGVDAVGGGHTKTELPVHAC